MIIVGLDISMNSTGCVSFELDDNYNVIDSDYFSFCSVKKYESEKVKYFHKTKDFTDDYHRIHLMHHHIMEFVSNADYIGIEGYSYGSKGKVFEIAEFSGNLKKKLYDANIPFRIYDPQSIKMFAIKGQADKLSMKEAYDSLEDPFKFDLSHLPIVKTSKGISPTSDIVDAYFIAKLLTLEIQLRKGITELRKFDERIIRVFNRVTTSYPTNILDQEFIQKKW